jgi:hypothetical protein
MAILNKSVTVLIIIFVAMTYKSAGQYRPDISRLSYYDSSGERGFTTFIYGNNASTPYKAIWELEDGSRWSANYHSFDSLGNMISKHRDFSDYTSIDQVFSYDSEGRQIMETFHRSDRTNGYVEYFYKDSILVYADCHGFNGWFHGKIQYLYDEEGIGISAILLNSDNEQVGSITYQYDDQNRLNVEKWEFNSGASQVYNYEYLNRNCTLYASSNVFMRPSCDWIIEKETYTFLGKESGTSYYNYDEFNKLLHKTFIRSDGLRTETDFYYDKYGLLERSVRKYTDGSTGTFLYRFDDNRNLVRRDFRSGTLCGSEEYSYDNLGRLIEGAYLNFDSWLTGRLTFHHDRYDRINYADFTTEMDLNAAVTFKYDEYLNLITIDWLFENGLSRSCHFSYLRTTNSRREISFK